MHVAGRGKIRFLDISAVLLIALTPRIHRDIALPSLLVDIAMPRLGGVGSKVGGPFDITWISRPLFAPTGRGVLHRVKGFGSAEGTLPRLDGLRPSRPVSLHLVNGSPIK